MTVRRDTPRFSSATTAPSVARLMKSYKHYMIDCMNNRIPIMSIYDFYNHQVRCKEISKSRVYERYLRELQGDQYDI